MRKRYICVDDLLAALKPLRKTEQSTIRLNRLIPMIESMSVVPLSITRKARTAGAVEANMNLHYSEIRERIDELVNLSFDDGYWEGWDQGREALLEEREEEEDEV